VLLSSAFAEGLLPKAFPDWSALQLWTLGTFGALMFSVSILLHELSHCLVARHYGLPVLGITLFMFDGVSKMGRPETAQQECTIALVGPLTNLGLSVTFAFGYFVLRNYEPAAAYVFGGVAAINFVLGIFNLLPGFPMDGGRVLRSVIWSRCRSQIDATRMTSCIAKYLSHGALGVGIFLLFVNPSVAILIVLITNTMRVASASSYKRLLMAV